MATNKDTETLDESTPLLRSRPEEKVRWGAKHTLSFMGLLGIGVEYCQRVSLSVAIVAMVGPGNSTKNNTSPESCPIPDDLNSDAHKHGEGEFTWDKETQGIVLGAFFWGYASTNIIGGRLSEYIGGKMVFGLGILASSLLSILSPTMANASVELFIFCRILLGVFQGVTFPSINSMLATWILPQDRSTFSTIVYSGFQIGTVIGLLVTGWLCNLKFLGGWPLNFYVFGVLGVIWAIAWSCIIYDRPEHHPGISSTELRQLILNYESRKQAEVLPIPWKGVLTSLPFWAVMASSLGNDYGFYTLLTELPTYLHDVQHYNIENNGALSALPYCLMWFFSIVWAAFMNYLTKKGTLAIVNIRRLSTAVALYGPMIGLIAMCFVNCNATLATSVLCIFGMFNGAVNSGYLCSHQDIAPNLAGTLLGITNTVGALSGIAAPAITSYIIADKGTLWEWRTVFLISVGLYLVNCTIYLFLISADIQPWNEPVPIEGTSGVKDSTNSEYQHAPADELGE